MVELATTAEKAAQEGNMKQLYDTTKKLEVPVKDNESKTITETEGKWKRWLKQFEELLDMSTSLNPPSVEALLTYFSTDITPPTIEEIRIAGHQINQEWKSSKT
ncbi:unnamed protein product [Schistosoma mattheei]|uniref:Uncharacterized protein n=1 Tax=Schistosoma mattheei TaxID=31246 RepID=A0A183PJV7_9TREM|nr:unnamed protein product [Schistosoma mattheei]